MNNTPAAPAATPEPTGLHASFLKSLQLTVTPSDPAPSASGAPVPDSGIEVPSTIIDFSERSGSIADKLRKIERDIAAAPPTPEPTTPPVVTSPAPVTPPPAPAPVAPTPATPPAEPVTPPPPQAELPRVKIPAMPKPVTQAPVLPPPPSQLDLSGLDEDDIEEVRTAEFAEQQHPQKYSGHASKVLDFIKKHKDLVRQMESEDPNVSFDRDNARYQRFLQENRPPVTPAERKRLERERLLSEAATAAERKLSEKTKRLEEELVHLKAAPLVERTINDYKALLKQVMPTDDDPLLQEAVGFMQEKATKAASEFLYLASNLQPFDNNNDTHKWLADFIQEQGELYAKSGHPSLKRGGRSFAPRAKFNSMPAAERSKYFTFEDEDVLQLIAVNAKAAAEYHANNERERLKKAGYTRTPTSPAPAAPTTPPVPSPTPPSPRAGTSLSSGGPVTPAVETDPVLRWINR